MMGGCVFTLQGKKNQQNIHLTEWKISDMSLSLQSLEVARVVHMEALWFNTQTSPEHPWHLLLFSPDSLLSATFLSPFTPSYVLSCFSLTSLSCWQNLSGTTSAMACWRRDCFICAALGAGRVLPWRTLSRHTHNINEHMWAYESFARWFLPFKFWPEWITGELMEGSAWMEGERENTHKNESWLILSELEATAPSQNMGACLF